MKYLTIPLLLFILSCNSESKLERAHSFKASTIELIKNKSFTAALDTAQIALELYEKTQDKNGQAEMYFHLARASAMNGNFQEARLYGEKGSVFCKEIEDLELEYKINNILSWSYFSLGMGFKETIDHQNRQLKIVNQLDDGAAKAMVYNNYGYDATVSGLVHLDSAIKHMKWANDYYGKQEKTHGRWYTLMNLCWQYRLKYDLETSQVFGLHSLAQAKADSDRHAIIEAATNLSETFIARQSLEEADEKLKEVNKLANEQVDRDKYVYDIYYAHYLGEIGKPEEAIELLKSSVDFLSTGEIFYEMLGRAYLATYALKLNQEQLVQEQLDVFSNPRAGYISMKAKVIAAIAEAKMNSNEQMLNEWIKKSRTIGAAYLVEQLEKVKAEITG